MTLVVRDLHLELVYDTWTLWGSVDGCHFDEHIPLSGYAEQAATFIDAIASHDQSLIRCSYRDGLATLAMTLAANRSLLSGRPEVVTA